MTTETSVAVGTDVSELEFKTTPWSPDQDLEAIEAPEPPRWRTHVTARHAITDANWSSMRAGGFRRLLQAVRGRQGSLLCQPAKTADMLVFTDNGILVVEAKFQAHAHTSASPLDEVLDDLEAFKARHDLGATAARLEVIAKRVFGRTLREIGERVEHDSDFGGEYLAWMPGAESRSQEEFSVLRRKFFETMAAELADLKRAGEAGDLTRLVVTVRRHG